MLLRSNIAGVISTLERYQAGLPGAIGRATAPDERWRNVLRDAAARALSGLADETQAGFVPPILDSLTGAVVGGRTLFTLTLSLGFLPRAGFPVDVARARQFVLGGAEQGGEFVSAEDNLEAVKQAVRDWVYQEKRLDDYEYADPEEAVDAMMEILGFQPNRQNVYTPAMNTLAEKIAGHVQDFITARAATSPETPVGLDARTLRQWAEAILLTWRAVAADEVFHRLRAELNRLRRQIAGGELVLQ